MIRVTVRRLIDTPSSLSSNAIRDADHLWSLRHASIWSTISGGVAVGWRRGVDDRSNRPTSPYARHRFTHFDAQAREIPISAATWAIGLVWQRSTSRRRPSGVNGVFLCVPADLHCGRIELFRVAAVVAPFGLSAGGSGCGARADDEETGSVFGHRAVFDAAWHDE